MNDLRVPAVRFSQNGRVFYTAVIPAGDLVARSRVDVWEPDVPEDQTGYQRAPSATRKRQIAEYVARRDAILPAGGFANVRSEDGSAKYGQILKFAPSGSDDASGAAGILTIPSDVPIWIVDMQHRTGGFEVAIENDPETHVRNFPLVVTIADGISKLEEIEQFEIINTNQKKVRTDLARRLLAIQSHDPDKRLTLDRLGKLWEARGPVVVDYLRSSEGVWKDRIMPPNRTKAECPKAIVRETSFVSTLKPVLLQPYFMRATDTAAATFISRYWEALSQLLPDAFRYPAEHVIQKTPGIYPLHAIFPEVFEHAREAGGPTVENFMNILKPVTERFDSAFWASDADDGASQYGSAKGFAILAAEMRRYLPQLDFDED